MDALEDLDRLPDLALTDFAAENRPGSGLENAVAVDRHERLHRGRNDSLGHAPSSQDVTVIPAGSNVVPPADLRNVRMGHEVRPSP